MKATRYILILAIFLITTSGLFTFTGCSDELAQTDILTPEQKALIGRAVIFEPYIEGMQTRAYNHDGFNHNDIMYIFRQGFNADGTYAQEEPWKAYQFTAQTDPSGNILFSQWEIQLGDACGFRGNTQGNKDSIYWENGKSVRFRAYAKSSIKSYNDYLYADYISVSGPMGSVPMEFKHLGCRIGFQPFAGNTIVGVDYCTDPEDYKRKDNADSKENADKNDMLSDEEAEKVAKDVENAFNKLCMPGGVAMYSDADNNWYDREDGHEVGTPTVQYGQLTAMAIGGTGEILAKDVKTEGDERNIERPNWNANLDGTRYCIVVPYEMSGDNAGSSITIPAKTRFKIYLKDVNTDNQENEYHIFSLQDIKDDGGNSKYPDGLTMRAGYSYVFVVGYKYDQLVVRVNEEGLNWKLKQPSVSLETEQETVTDSKPDYSWWVNAMNKAADEAMADKKYDAFNPVFTIKSIKEWKEFTDIVNGELPDGGITYKKYIPTEGTSPKHIEETTLNTGFDFGERTISLKIDIDFQDQAIKSIGKDGHPFSGTFEGNGHTLSNFSGTVFGYVKNADENDTVRVSGLVLKSTQNISLINEAEGAMIMGISVNGPSQHAITTKINNSIVNCVCHIGIGNNNGSLLGTGSGNRIISSYIAAAGEGTLTDDTSFGGNFVGCYYDKTLAPVTSAIGQEYIIEHNDVITESYGARAVISPVLKAIKDNIPGDNNKKQQPNVFYGHAPYNVMNANKGKSAEKYEYTVSVNYNDRYPVLNITKE